MQIIVTLDSPYFSAGTMRYPLKRTWTLMLPSGVFGALSTSTLVLATDIIDPIFLHDEAIKTSALQSSCYLLTSLTNQT
jgi:hypothetical protein